MIDPTEMSITTLRLGVASAVLGLLVVCAGVTVPRGGNAKSLIDYFQPTPTVCPVTTNTWGSNVPRDA